MCVFAYVLPSISYGADVADIGFPRNQMMKLQDTDDPTFVHMKCSQIDESRIECQRVMLEIKSDQTATEKDLMAQINELLEAGSTLDESICGNPLNENAAEMVAGIKEKISEIEAEADQISAEEMNNYKNNKRLIQHSLVYFETILEYCENGLNKQTAVAMISELQSLNRVMCNVQWMPDYPKEYVFDAANRQWTYKLEHTGLCGRQVTLENIQPSNLDGYSNLHQLEILNIYPEAEPNDACKLGIARDKPRLLFSQARTVYKKECLSFTMD